MPQCQNFYALDPYASWVTLKHKLIFFQSRHGTLQLAWVESMQMGISVKRGTCVRHGVILDAEVFLLFGQARGHHLRPEARGSSMTRHN